MMLSAARIILESLVWAQSGVITTYAGTVPLGDGGPALEAALAYPMQIAGDRHGNLYFTDRQYNRIRRIRADGTIATVALANQPVGIAVDGDGVVYFSEATADRVRRINPDGSVVTVAGSGVGGFSGDGGPATSAMLNSPTGLAIDGDGNLYIADMLNRRVRRVRKDGSIETVAGGGTDLNVSPVKATEARLGQPDGIGFDAAGNLYISEEERDRVHKVSADGTITVVAGGGRRNPIDGIAAVEAGIACGPIAVAGSGELLVAGTTGWIYRVTREGVLQIVAGNGTRAASGDGGLAREAQVGAIEGLHLDGHGSIYFADVHNHTIRRIGPDGGMERFAGVDLFGSDQAPATYARLMLPSAVGSFGTALYLMDYSARFRRIQPSGRMETVAGTGIADFQGEGVPAAQAMIVRAVGVAFGEDGSIVLGDNGGGLNPFSGSRHRIRRISPDGIIRTLAGTGLTGFSGDGGPARDAQLAGPGGVAVDQAGNVYIADTGNNRIRKVDAAGIITTVAGNGQAGLEGDNGPATEAALNGPRTVALDKAGNLFIADNGNRRVRRLSPDGILSTYAGDGRNTYAGDGGPARNAAFRSVTSLSVDEAGNVFVADANDNRIRKISPSGVITTSAGNGVRGFSGDGGIATGASLNAPSGVAVDERGTIYIADAGNHRIRRVEGNIAFLANPGSLLLSFGLGAPAQQRSIAVTVPDGSSRPFEAASTAAWLRVSPASGTVLPGEVAQLLLTIDPAGLGKGSYNGRVRISNPRNSNEFTDVGVSITISGTPQQLLLSQTGLLFGAVQGAGAPPGQTIRVLNAGVGSMPWTAATTTLAGGAGWLVVGSAAGVSAAGGVGSPLDVRVNAQGLAAGTYFGQVTVSAPGADNSPHTATVVLSVLPADRPPGPVVNPLGVLVTGVAGGANPANQEIQVANISGRSITVTSALAFPDQRTWFTVGLPAGGSILPGQSGRVEVRPVIQGIPAGTYRGTLTLRFAPDNLSTIVNLLLVVAPATAALASEAQKDRDTTAGCVARRLNPLFRAPGQAFSATASWPVPVEVQVVDDCGQPLTAGQVVVSFNSGDAPIELRPTGEGRWTGTWAARNIRTGLAITARAVRLDPRVEGAVQITGAARDNPEQPVIAAGGVVNGANRRAEVPLSPGVAVSILGARLAREQRQVTTLPLPGVIGETSAFLAGRPMPLRSVGEARLEGVVPFSIADSTVHQLVVRRGNALSVPEPVVVAAAGPSVYGVEESGTGQGRILVQREEGEPVLADAVRPARAGERVLLLCVGLGAVKGEAVAGQAAPEPPLELTAAVRVTIQGLEAEVLGAVLAPGLTGVYQVTARVPDGIVADANTLVVVRVNDQASPVVTMAVGSKELP